jgi:hypothetical protein
MKKNPEKKNGKVLSSYRKVGTKFVPPLLQTFQLDHISWSSQTMPELVWWDVLIDTASHRFAARVAEEIARYFRVNDNRDRWWAFISDYSHLSDESALELRAYLAEVNILSQLTESLGDLLNLVPRLSDLKVVGLAADRFGRCRLPITVRKPTERAGT